MSNRVILLKRPNISPNIAPRGSECKNNFESFPGVEFDLLTTLNGVIILKCPYFSLIIGAMVSEYKDRP